MKKGKIYNNLDKSIFVMCTYHHPSHSIFEGVIIKSEDFDDPLVNVASAVGTVYKQLSVHKFTETVGQVDLNNVFIK